MLVFGAVGAGAAAGLGAILAALGAPTATISQAKAAEATITYHSVRFGHNRVAVETKPGGLMCFRLKKGSSTVGRSCAQQIGPGQIEYASSRYAVGGLAGSKVKAVIVKLTRKGTVWAKLEDGAFYAVVPKGYNIRAVIKVLGDGSKTTFTVTGPR